MSDYISKSALIDLFKDLADEHETNAISYNALCEVILQQKTISETEIIRKAFERVVERLDKQAGEFIDLSHRELSNNSIPAIKYLNKGFGVAKAIEIVKEECGINE